MWQARFYQALPQIVERYPKARWVFLTLTLRNCPVNELGATLTHINKSWQRLIQRKELRPVLGWIRGTEVTRGDDGSAHPHCHILLMVPPSWFSRHYVRHARWVQLWRECLRIDYDPIVYVCVVKSRKPKVGESCTVEFLRGAVAEVLKYSVKPADMLADGSWFRELTRQTHKRRFVATGGALRDVLRLDRESNEDLALLDEGDGDDEEEGRLAFAWRRLDRRYRRAPKLDVDD